MALDLSTPKPPPAKKPSATSARASAAKTAEREDGLKGLGQIASFVLTMTRNHADAGAVSMHWPNVATEAAQLAENNAGVAKAIDTVTAVGPFAGILAAAMPLVLQILVNHGRVPAAPLAQFGVVSPAALEAKAQADLMKQEADIRRMQAEAEADLRDSIAAQNGHVTGSVPA